MRNYLWHTPAMRTHSRVTLPLVERALVSQKPNTTLYPLQQTACRTIHNTRNLPLGFHTAEESSAVLRLSIPGAPFVECVELR
jgi:hypothetical protein